MTDETDGTTKKLSIPPRIGPLVDALVYIDSFEGREQLSWLIQIQADRHNKLVHDLTPEERAAATASLLLTTLEQNGYTIKPIVPGEKNEGG